MHIRPLTDEIDRQQLQCMQHGVRLDDDDGEDESATAWGADPFDIVAALEAEQGYPLVTN